MLSETLTGLLKEHQPEPAKPCTGQKPYLLKEGGSAMGDIYLKFRQTLHGNFFEYTALKPRSCIVDVVAEPLEHPHLDGHVKAVWRQWV